MSSNDCRENDVNSPQAQQRRLDRLAAQIKDCTQCPALVENRTCPVPGSGAPNARIMLIGEAPGKQEDRQGVPFVGPAGQTLNELFEAVNLDRDQLFITSVIKCRPPNNRNPQRDEIANCRPYLERQITLVQPEAIGALGAIAAHWLLGNQLKLGRLRGELHAYQHVPVVCTYHPAYVRRNPTAKEQVQQDLLFLQEQVPMP